MYRCQICSTLSPPRAPLRRHVVYRECPRRPGFADPVREEIAREVPVCEDCETELKSGIALAELVRCFAKPVYLPAIVKPITPNRLGVAQ